MAYLGETISIVVAIMWTITALVSEIGSKRLGVMHMNVWRLATATFFTAILLFFTTGHAYPVGAGLETWLWMSLSGFIGFYFGDYCLFKSYVLISSRYGQLFMTLAPAAAAVTGFLFLDEHLTMMNILAMAVVMSGIIIVILPERQRPENKHVATNDADSHHDFSLFTFHFSLNTKLFGYLFGIGAGVGQGVGLVLSKIGMEHYMQDIAASDVVIDTAWLPFASNMIRCITGFACFFLSVLMSRKLGDTLRAATDIKGMSAMTTAVIFGPFIGVGLSLLAVQYTAAGIASTLMALTPVLIILPSFWLFRQPITWRGVIGATISVIGAAMFFL